MARGPDPLGNIIDVFAKTILLMLAGAMIVLALSLAGGP